MRFSLSFLVCFLAFAANCAAEIPESVLYAAGKNREELEQALEQAPPAQREGVEFLIRHMPLRDLQSLNAAFLLQNTDLAYQAWHSSDWAKQVPPDIFLNNVLPYASINERRDDWRADFRQRFAPLVKDAKSTSEAAALLNREIFAQLNVKYSTKRKKADQSPYESIEGGTASCTGLSVLLIDACRAVGVPARMVGTPLWTNKSGNHSWVEVWDDGWHFTGAAEPTGDDLNKGWFVGRAATAVRDQPIHAIYATSFKRTPLFFPCVWNPQIKYIPAVNVTDRYTALKKELPEGHVESQFVVRRRDGQRVAAPFQLTQNGEVVFSGRTKDEAFDANDHICVPLRKGQAYLLEIQLGDNRLQRSIKPRKGGEIIAIEVDAEKPSPPAASPQNAPPQSGQVDKEKSKAAVQALTNYLNLDPKVRRPLGQEPFASVPLTKSDAETARDALAGDWRQRVRAEREAELKSKVIPIGELEMPLFYRRFGEKPKDGWSLYISLHGGGGAPAAVNDGQWKNQQRLYQLKEGIYVAPRAPTNTWNLWHQGHIDRLFDRLIENMVACEDVNWNRVYVMGYSAGGDGVFQLAPRMADRWAAAAMMAGHPNETSPLGLRNVPFILQMGGKDAAYKRNEVAAEWKEKLAKLRADDPGGYDHLVKIYPDKGHWMDREDAMAIPWMAKRTRNATPKRIVWKQDDVTHLQFYWLRVDQENRKARSEVVAEVKDQTVTVNSKQVQQITLLLDDRLLDLDQPLKIESEGKVVFAGRVARTIAALDECGKYRADPNFHFPAAVTVELPLKFPQALVPDEEIPRYTATRTSEPLDVDGKLDEPQWSAAKKTRPFVDLVSGGKTLHETRSAILWDDKYLYIGFWLTEPNVQAKYQRRDDPLYYDNDAEVFIAGQNAYYEFEINAFGTVYEGFFIWDEAYDKDGYAVDPQLRRGVAKSQPFDGVGFKRHPRGRRTAFLGYDFPNFKSAVHVKGTLNDDSDEDQGWTVELAFPWKEMKWLAKGDGRALPPKPGDQWRIDLFRFNTYKASGPPADSGGWAWAKHGVWDSHIPEIFPIVTFAE